MPVLQVLNQKKTKTNNLKEIKDIPISDKNISINSVNKTNQMSNNIPEIKSTHNFNISKISEINLESGKVTNSEIIPNKEQMKQTELSNKLSDSVLESDQKSEINKSDNKQKVFSCYYSDDLSPIPE